ncbi:MAG: hypothetical protein JWM80_520 [Cyanobacteria bacterium RYN_339]|nr:hypothetical protein [Cyanobacteria bacterium RYN_339]
MPRVFDLKTYVALRGLLGPIAFVVLLVSALFGTHTPGAGYDDDDPNRPALVADFPRLALNGLNLRRNGEAPRAEAAPARPQALGKPHDDARLNAAGSQPNDPPGGYPPGLRLAVPPASPLASAPLRARPTCARTAPQLPRAPPLLA